MIRNRILAYLIDDALKKLDHKQALYDAFLSLKKRRQANPPSTMSEWHSLYTQCHNLYGQLGGVLTSRRFQAPSFWESVIEEAGDEKGSITPNLNDYKRDYHRVGFRYERAYQHAFRAPHALATVSGMAALTVAALYVRQRDTEHFRIAVGEHSYFENKELLTMMFPQNRIVYFDEDKPEKLLEIRPEAIFVDSLANDPIMTRADVRGIIRAAGALRHHVDIIIDTTCASVARCKIPVYSRFFRNVSILCFESLNKFHQFGLDRVTGGIIWSPNVDWSKLYTIRDHAGVNIPEASAAAIPTPNRTLHQIYLSRLEENACLIAQSLSKIPSLTITWNQGAFVSVSKKGASWQDYWKCMKRVMRVAKKHHVPIIAGSSFGMPVTRVYTWSPRSVYERPYFRLSPGLETRKEIASIIEIIINAVTGI